MFNQGLVIRWMDFARRWIQLIMMCVTMIQYVVIVNGKITWADLAGKGHGLCTTVDTSHYDVCNYDSICSYGKWENHVGRSSRKGD